MGMFDTVYVDYPMPDPAAQDLQFQTKDLACLLESYRITRAGRLVLRPWNLGTTPPDAAWEDMAYDGVLTFYGDRHTGDILLLNIRTGEDEAHPGPPPEWFEYVATFVGGRVQSIVRVGR